ncbi:MAG: rhomboid family intramembrane serine protease [Chloroflexota bacterium]|nr:rhomboid family intramembrane serine protease [Chloroflexota bacterium]
MGLTPAYFLHQPWTIVTSIFLHAGWGHIIFNMISLYFLGSFLVRLIGENKFLLIYLVGGVVGNILFIILAPPYSIGIGASGAIYALGGALMIMAPWVKVFIFPIPIPIPLWVAIIIFLLLSFLPGIAWEAHLGGLLFGLGAGYYFKQRRRRGGYAYRM